MGTANNTADIILHSLDNGSYSGFIYNLNATLIPSLDETTFKNLKDAMHNQYGHYISKSGPLTATINGMNLYVYNCTYSNGSVKLLLSMNLNNISMVEGIRFTAV